MNLECIWGGAMGGLWEDHSRAECFTDLAPFSIVKEGETLCGKQLFCHF